MGPAVELGLLVGIAVACAALGVARASFYRARRRLAPKVVANHPRHVPARALGATERAAVIEVLHQARFADLSVREVYAALLDDGRYLCSIATMYRLLRALGESRERRAQRQHPRYAMPRLVAAAPNQVWTWDITKLGGPVKWLYFSLYVVLDIFSRYVVGWLVAERENHELAGRLITQSMAKQGVTPGTLTVHSDRGAPMKAKPLVQLLADLGLPAVSAGRGCPTTIPSRRATSRRSSIARPFPNGSVRWWTRALSAGCSSPGTTTSIITPGLGS
jgi:putative transposase